MTATGRRERFAALRAVAELSSCTDGAIWSLIAYADEVRVFAGDEVVHEGRYCTELVTVMQGTLWSRSRLVGPAEILGWHEMWERLPNPSTVTAETDARLLVMSHDQFRAVKALVGPGIVRPLEQCPRSPSSEREVQSSLAS